MAQGTVLHLVRHGETSGVIPALLEDPAFFRIEGSETFDEVLRRAVSRLRGILERHRGQSILLVTHSVVVKLLLAHVEGRPLSELWQPPIIHPASLCRVVWRDSGAVIERHGDIGHYKEAL